MVPPEDDQPVDRKTGTRLPEELLECGEISESKFEAQRSVMEEQAEYLDNLGDAKRDVEIEDPIEPDE